MDASQSQVSGLLAGLPAIIYLSLNTSRGSGCTPQPPQKDTDIRALLRALPTKAFIEKLVLWVEEQHRQDFQQLPSEVDTLDYRFSKGESAVSALKNCVIQLEQVHASHRDSLAEMQLHLEDL